MSTAATIEYPFADGEPMADNMRQGWWMVMLFGNLDRLLDCFVGINNFWFPVEGEPEVRLAPDVYVAFGRPKGHRDSYKQWEEGDTPVTVVFEILSPKNTDREMVAKHQFYEEYGVEEYYLYDPKRNHLEVWIRRGSVLRRHHPANGFTSPRMGIRFDLSGPEMAVWRPDNRRFLTVAELDAEREQAEQAAVAAVEERDRAEQAAVAAVEERDRAKQAAVAAVEERDRAKVIAERALAEREQAERTAVQAAEQREQAVAERDLADRLAREAVEQRERAFAAQAAAELAARQEQEARAAAELAARQEQEARAAAEQAARQEQEARAAAETEAARLRERLSRLRELSRRARQGIATVDELAELERLEQETG